MKFTLLLLFVVLCIGVTVAKKEPKKSKAEMKKELLDSFNKDKREIPLSPYSHGGPPRSSHLLHLQPGGGGSSLNIGAGYSLGGGSKSPSFGYASQGHGGQSSHYPGLNSLTANSHGPVHASLFGGHSSGGPKIRYTSVSGSLHNPNNHFMSGGGHKYGGLVVGGGSHSPQFHSSQPSFGHSTKPQMSYGIPQYASLAKPEATYGTPSFAYSMPMLGGGHGGSSPSLPSYASGTHGLGAYATSGSHQGISGPLFTPASTHDIPSVTYGIPSGSHGAHSGGYSSSGNSFGGHGFSSGKKGFGGFLSSHSKPVFESGPSYSGSNKKAFRPSVYLGSSSEILGHNSHPHQSQSASFGLPSSSHASLLSGSPVYLTPKVISGGGHSNSFEGLNALSGSHGGDAFHGSASLTGNFEIPSAGHSASSLSFGPLTGGYSYAPPAFGHDSDSSSFLGAGSNHGHEYLSGGSDSSSLGHVSLGGFGTSQFSFGSPSPTYGTPINVDDGPAINFNIIGSGKQDLPSTTSHSFSNLGHGASSLSSSFSVGDHGMGSPSNGGSHKLFGPPKGSYSSQNAVYASPSDDNFGVQSENRYDTIKYSRDFNEKEEMKQ